LHYRNDEDIEHPILVHKHLLDGRTVRIGVVFDAELVEHANRKQNQHNANTGTPRIPDNQKAYLADKINAARRNMILFPLQDSMMLPLRLGVPKYCDLVKQPMDLRKIESKLAYNEYKSVQDFTNDLNLMLGNAAMLVGQNSSLDHAAKKFRASAKRFMAKLPAPDQTLMEDNAEPQSDSEESIAVSIGLDSRRALMLWSGWLSGKPLWTSEDCTDVNKDLACLASMDLLCAGNENGEGRDHKALNACSDAIRQILLQEAQSLSNPLQTLAKQIDNPTSKIFTMLIDVLVYSNCASDGKTEAWLQEMGGLHSVLYQALSIKFAKKMKRVGAPDLMARCAYHTHPGGSQCDRAI
jgi:hypothetical protein